MQYNFLNLPTSIGAMSLTYDAKGRKWKKDGEFGAVLYDGGIEYRDGKLEAINLPDGRMVAEYNGGPGITRFRAEYFHEDHLGNTRLAFSDFNQNGYIELTEEDPGTPEQELEVTQEAHYYPFGMGHMGPWYATVAPENKYLYNGKELNEDYGINLMDYGARWYDGAVGRFTGVDPIADQFPHVTTYNYAENEPIANIDLWGLQKLSIHGIGGAGSAYTSSDNNSFQARALALSRNNGYRTVGVSNGQGIVNALQSETRRKGYVSSVVSFAHGTDSGIILNNNSGFYTNSDGYNTDAASVDDIVAAMEDGSINFSSDATWVLGSCRACGITNASGDLAYDITDKTGVTTIGATDIVEPEIKNGKETGRLTTQGKFIKTEKVFDVTLTASDGTEIKRVIPTSQLAQAFANGFNYDGSYNVNIQSRIKKTDLGNIIDPSKQ